MTDTPDPWQPDAEGTTDPSSTAGDATTPEDLLTKITRLETIVSQILLADGVSADLVQALLENTTPPKPGTAAPVAETADIDGGGPWSWVGVSAKRRTALSEELTAFVRWLDERYLRHLSVEQYQFPPNWYDSPVAVETLTAVMAAHQAVYTDLQDEPTTALSEWHERVLWPALDRLQSVQLFTDNRLITRDRNAVTGPDTADALVTAATRSLAALHATAASAQPDDISTAAEDVDAADAVTAPIPIIRTAN